MSHSHLFRAPTDLSVNRGPAVAARLFLARLTDGAAGLYGATSASEVPAAPGHPAEAALARLCRALPAASRGRLARYRQARAALHSAAAETIVRIAASAFLQADMHERPWSVAAHGKPYWPDCPLSFSLSHTEGLVAVMLSPGDVGVDVERIRSVDLRLMDRFCSPDERAALREMPEPDRLAVLFDLWTLKESYAKAVGRGISLRFSSFTIESLTEQPRLQGEGASKWRLRRYDTGRADERLAVCAAAGDWYLPNRAESLSFAALCDGELAPDTKG